MPIDFYRQYLPRYNHTAKFNYPPTLLKGQSRGFTTRTLCKGWQGWELLLLMSSQKANPCPAP